MGDALGIGLYGMVAGLALLFLGLSLIYFLRTRWYLFPLLYLNFSYFGERFFYVQDGSYLVMLTVVMAALFAARRVAGRGARADGRGDRDEAVAALLRAAPAVDVTARPPCCSWRSSWLGLVAPYFIWDNYLYIFRYNNELKGDTLVGRRRAGDRGAVRRAAVASSNRGGGFDLEDLIGWSLVPIALFLAFKMNVARHLLLVLLVPDKRGLRNVAAGVGAGAAHAAAVGRLRQFDAARSRRRSSSSACCGAARAPVPDLTAAPRA